MPSLPPELDFTDDPSATPERMDKAMLFILAYLRRLESVQPEFLSVTADLKATGLARLDAVLSPIFVDAQEIEAQLTAIRAAWITGQPLTQLLADLRDQVTARLGNVDAKLLANLDAVTQRLAANADTVAAQLAANLAAVNAKLAGLAFGTTEGKIPAIGPNNTLDPALIPTVLSHNLDVTTPNNQGSTGGLRIRANALGQAFLQFTDDPVTRQLGYFLIGDGICEWSGIFTQPAALAYVRDGLRSGNSDVTATLRGIWAAAESVALIDAPTIAVDMRTFINAHVFLGGNRTLGAPSYVKPGQTGSIQFFQPSQGGCTLAFASGWNFGATIPTLSAFGGARDVLRYEVLHDGRVDAYLAKGR